MLDGHLQVFQTQAILAHVAILVQTITYVFLMWTGRCCLISILLFSVAVVGWELSPFPSTYVSYNQRPQESVCAFLVCYYSVSLGFLFRLSLGVLQPTTLVRSQLHRMHLVHPT